MRKGLDHPEAVEALILSFSKPHELVEGLILSLSKNLILVEALILSLSKDEAMFSSFFSSC